MGSLLTNPKVCFPVALGHQQRSRLLCQLHLLRILLSFASPFALSRASPRLVADTLLVSCPSRDQTAQTLEPLTHLSPCRLKTRRTRRNDSRHRGASTPQRRVKPPQHPKVLAQLRRQHPALFRTGPHHPSVATPSSPDLPTDGHPPALAFGAMKYLGS